MIRVHVTIDLKNLKRFQTVLQQDLRGSGSGPIRAALRQWAARFRSFVQLRFDKFSKGGGDWKPLADSTKKRRAGARKGAKGLRSFAILRDTGTLFMALTPTFSNKPGQFQEDIPFGVRVGFGGPARHPKGAMSVADLARFHQEGAGHLPARIIITEPDASVQRLMASDIQRALGKLAQGGS
jgi:hypothetical protein